MRLVRLVCLVEQDGDWSLWAEAAAGEVRLWLMEREEWPDHLMRATPEPMRVPAAEARDPERPADWLWDLALGWIDLRELEQGPDTDEWAATLMQRAGVGALADDRRRLQMARAIAEALV